MVEGVQGPQQSKIIVLGLNGRHDFQEKSQDRLPVPQNWVMFHKIMLKMKQWCGSTALKALGRVSSVGRAPWRKERFLLLGLFR